MNLLIIIPLLASIFTSCTATNGSAVSIVSGNSTGTSSGGGTGGISCSDPVSTTTDCTQGCTATTAYVFPTVATTDAGLGVSTAAARIAADNMCKTERDSNRSALTCMRVKALISVTASDEIRDLPTTCSSTISSTTTAIKRPDSTALASTWNNFLADSLSASVITATDGGGFISGLWTGSTTAGALNVLNCSGFTDNGAISFAFGTYANGVGGSGIQADGNPSPTTSNYLGTSNISCTNAFSILCICF